MVASRRQQTDRVKKIRGELEVNVNYCQSQASIKIAVVYIMATVVPLDH